MDQVRVATFYVRIKQLAQMLVRHIEGHLSPLKVFLISFGLTFFLTACQGVPSPTLSPTPDPNFDPPTQALIARADRVVFLIPFSHWDTDWHAPFSDYAQRADHNILAAIQIAKKDPRFRYTLEQVLFVQHFWENYPQYQEDLKALVQNRQFTFAWGGITQPETSLAAPAIQVRNLLSGKEWIAATFGADYLPVTAWQSDAFGNSAAFPIFLAQSGIRYLFIGRWQDGCNPNRQNCQRLPLAFYWQSPIPNPSAGDAPPVLVNYIEYSLAWGATFNKTSIDDQITSLRKMVDDQVQRTSSKYLLIPFGFDFLDPPPDLPDLVDRWNERDQRTVLVFADPETAFGNLATQKLPQVSTDLNPIWQAFYASRPFAKIADKESEYYLTAADKFNLLTGGPSPEKLSSAWEKATISAHYDNIGAVSFDQVWESSQLPRFQATLTEAADSLAAVLARIASGVIASSAKDLPGPILTVFNPSSWPRSGIVELRGDLPDLSRSPIPVQVLGPNRAAIMVQDVPAVGYISIPGGSGSAKGLPAVSHPVSVAQHSGTVILSNGLVSVSLDSRRGGTFSSLSLTDGSSPPFEFLAANSDEVIDWEDRGDIYGASFGQIRARESGGPAQVSVLAGGPLVARVQMEFSLEGLPVAKIVTLQAGSPLVEVALTLAVPPQTTAVVQMATVLETDIRTDDLGFAAFTHPMDSRPISPGDITYRREIFYPITYWSDVSKNGHGLTLITHGLQGLAGTGTLNLMLLRQATDPDHEGVTDAGDHTLHYAYLPHSGGAEDARPWLAAYSFNQPLIPVWSANGHLNVQIPFSDEAQPHALDLQSDAPSFPTTASLISAENGIVADLIGSGDQTRALVIQFDPGLPTTVQVGNDRYSLPAAAVSLLSIHLK